LGNNLTVGIGFWAVTTLVVPELVAYLAVSEATEATAEAAIGLGATVVQPFLPTTANPNLPLQQASDQQIHDGAKTLALALIERHGLRYAIHRGGYASRSDADAVVADGMDLHIDVASRRFNLTDQYGFDSNQNSRSNVFAQFGFCVSGLCTAPRK